MEEKKYTSTHETKYFSFLLQQKSCINDEVYLRFVLFCCCTEGISFLPSSPTSNRRKDFSSTFFGGCFAQPPSVRSPLFLSRNDEDDDKQPHYYFILLRYSFSPKYCLDTAIISLFSTTFFAATLQTPSVLEDVFSYFSLEQMWETGATICDSDSECTRVTNI